MTGYIDGIVKSKEDTFWAEKGVGEIFFYLKHNELDDKYDGILCRTDDEKFLDLNDNTPIKIEAVFIESTLAQLYKVQKKEIWFQKVIYMIVKS